MLRRNGKPRSCEPCRISKIKCDHAEPTCAKCVARGMVEQCFYHPNPMTKPAGTPRKKPERRRARDLGRLTSLTLSPPTLRNDINGGGCSATPWPTPPTSSSRTTKAGADPARSFYLGSTSYASVFTEDRPLPDTLHQQPAERMSLTPSSTLSSKPGTRFCQMGMGNSVISRLAPFSFYEESLKMYLEECIATPYIGPLILSLLPQLREDLQQLTNPENDISHMYSELTKNTAKPLKVPSTMLPSEFHTLLTGQNLRWETLGLVLVIAANNAQFTSPSDPIFDFEDGRTVDKDELVEDILQAANDCITLCQVHGAVNDVMAWLVYDHGTWRRLGDSISSLYATGMHCEENVHHEPSFLREARRRHHAVTYRSDKTLATFLGRPPMMAWRYSDRRQPLDISDEILAADDPEVLNQAILRLDSAGWNTEGNICSASVIRLRCQHAVYKERLLEQSLAGEKDGNVIRNLQSIALDCTQFWESLPAHMRYDCYTEEEAWVGLGPRIAIRLFSSYMDYLQTHAQIQRMLHRLTQEALPALLEVSLKLLSTSLVVTKPNNGGYETRRHFAIIILFCCFPAAGVLALELRRCTLEGKTLPSTVSRADVIRNLSVLTSSLEWMVLPGDGGNHKLCSELNKMLALVLDEVLNYQPAVPNEQNGDIDFLAASGNGFFDLPLVDGLEPIPTEAEDFLYWLDNATSSNNVSLF
ncbi:hypothetical protein CC86DRAFT_390249 [Ophiobolus disseminans]|uniref:Zn(2)-C6 fungal-type domain-containing protein n=1 Tax=Ophiobolus disseminans TaxID=1469910 RepID=A0A6A7AGL9_9PLEO|nr:hypothetical protein CC86DRAFT_390249 [Ophiobolus disseminans]